MLIAELFSLLIANSTVHAHILYEGPVPVPQRLPVEVNADVCGAKRPILSERLLVSADRGLANTAGILLGVEEEASTEGEDTPPDADLNQQNCVFMPHVQTVTEGRQLVINNSDRVIHNVHARLGDTTVFNLGMPLRGVKLKRPVGAPGVMSLRCDSGHNWMQAYVVVVPNRYHATSDNKGSLTIENVPPGEYVLRTWHEALGVIDSPVVVKDGEDTEVRVAYKGPAKAKPAALTFEGPTKPAASPEAFAAVEAAQKLTRNEAKSAELASRRAARDADIAAGRPLYARYCAACHGDTGDGDGEAAGSLKSHPRDFRRGEYKFRSTKSGALPTEDDILRTISTGIPGTDMPAWRSILSAGERRVLARYVTTFSLRFVYALPSLPITVPPETPDDEPSRKRGEEIFKRLQCAQCHGVAGDADGVAKKMFDDWGEPIHPSDLTRGVYKAGPKPEDRFRTLVTGLSGTPMASFADVIGPDETWDLVHYVDSLAEKNGLRSILGVP